MKVLDPLQVPLTGRVLIEASAGTGKTYTITTLVLRSVLEQGTGIDQALVVTFTNAATEELKARVRERLSDALAASEAKARGVSIADPTLARLFAERRDPEGDRQRLQAAVRAFDEAGIFTIHGFCQRVLEEHALSSGLRFDLELSADVEVLLRELVEDFWQSALAGASEAQARHASAKLGVSALMRLAWLVLGAADVRLAPPCPDVVDPAPAVKRYVAARSRARAAWRTARGEVFELLADNPALRRDKCRPEKLAECCERMDAVVGETRAALWETAKPIEFFTRDGVRKITKKNSTPPEHAFFGVCDELGAAHAAAEQALDTWCLGLEHAFLSSVSSELALRKQRRGLLSFDDLLKELRAALRAPGGRELAALIRTRYPVALIDEFQDTDPAQYEIFSRIYSDGGTLILIGDPKQAIYGFRGADVFTYLKAAEDTGDRAWTLGTNYRSDPKLICAVNALFSRVSAPFAVEQIGFSRVEARPDAGDRADLGARGPFEIAFLPRDRFGTEKSITKSALERELPRLVAADVVDQLERWRRERSRLGAGDIAVLTRTNRQAHAVQAALSALGVPTALGGDASVLDSHEASELARVMAALCEPVSARRVRAALATDLFGVTAEEFVRLEGDEAAFEAWLQNFSDWHATWKERGFMQAFRRMLRERDLEARVLGLGDGERRLTNFLHLSELVQKADGSRHLGMLGATRWFDEVRSDPAAREGMTADAQQIRLERDAFAVQLTTVHRSKGLEYPVVYCPYLWGSTRVARNASRELRYHDPNDGRLVLDLEPDPAGEAFDRADREALSEALRLAYVALTRAKHRAVVYWGAVNGRESSALGYLLHQGGEQDDPRRRAPGSRLRDASDSELWADLERLARAAEATIELRRAERGLAPRFEPEPVRARAIRAREPERRLDRSWRSSSFSALAASSSAVAPPAVELGRDRDASEASDGRAGTERPFAAKAAPRKAWRKISKICLVGSYQGSGFGSTSEPKRRASAPKRRL